MISGLILLRVYWFLCWMDVRLVCLMIRMLILIGRWRMVVCLCLLVGRRERRLMLLTRMRRWLRSVFWNRMDMRCLMDRVCGEVMLMVTMFVVLMRRVLTTTVTRR